MCCFEFAFEELGAETTNDDVVFLLGGFGIISESWLCAVDDVDDDVVVVVVVDEEGKKGDLVDFEDAAAEKEEDEEDGVMCD